jgi:heat shock protein HtpX
MGSSLGGHQGAALAFGFAILMNVGAYWFSDRLVLRMYKAEPVDEAKAPELYGIVAELAQRASIPMPKIYVIPSETPNAFATGRNPQHAAVAVTQGILRILSRDELRGVLAHELSHVGNRDTLISCVAATLVGAFTYLAQMAQFAAIFGGGRPDDDEGGSPLALLGVAIFAGLAASLLQLAVSRSREFEADASAARLLGEGEPLARSLEKLEMGARMLPMDASPATAHLFIVSPLTGGGAAGIFAKPAHPRDGRAHRTAARPKLGDLTLAPPVTAPEAARPARARRTQDRATTRAPRVRRALARRESGAYADLALHAALAKSRLDLRDRAFATELCFGTLRFRGRLDFLLAQVLAKPLARIEARVQGVLRLGAYQLVFCDRVPDAAAVSESVRLAHATGLGRAAGLVNAALRRLARGAMIACPPVDDPVAHPLHASRSALARQRWIAATAREAAARPAARTLRHAPCAKIAAAPRATRCSPGCASCSAVLPLAPGGLTLGRRRAAWPDPAFQDGRMTVRTGVSSSWLLDPSRASACSTRAPGAKATSRNASAMWPSWRSIATPGDSGWSRAVRQRLGPRTSHARRGRERAATSDRRRALRPHPRRRAVFGTRRIAPQSGRALARAARGDRAARRRAARDSRRRREALETRRNARLQYLHALSRGERRRGERLARDCTGVAARPRRRPPRFDRSWDGRRVQRSTTTDGFFAARIDAARERARVGRAVDPVADWSSPTRWPIGKAGADGSTRRDGPAACRTCDRPVVG